jgi:GTP-binding protein
MRVPVLAIVGRPNVGKSSVFNRLAGRRVSIVHDQPGVTRDRVAAGAGTLKVALDLLDTGGIGEPVDDGFSAQVEMEAEVAMEEADLILLVVDAKTGVTPVDEMLADRLRRKATPVMLAINKVDGREHESIASDFLGLGVSEVFTLSAATGRGFGPLREALEARFPAARDDTAGEPVKVAIIGRPNVGKSSLINAVLNDRRTIVSGTAGTTRDAIDIPFVKDGQPYILIDTAGLRRRTKVDSVVEAFSVQRARDSVRRADVVALVIDAAEGVAGQERKIAAFILGEHKPCILVANKFDLYHPTAKFRARFEELRDSLAREFFFMPYAPVVAVSAKDRQDLGKIFRAIETIRRASEVVPGTGALNRLLREAIEHRPPPAIKGRRLKLLYATLARPAEPRAVTAPTVVCFVNYTDLLTEPYRRYLEGRIRESFPFEGLPLRFDVRERRREEQPGPAALRASQRAAKETPSPRRKPPAPAGSRRPRQSKPTRPR